MGGPKKCIHINGLQTLKIQFFCPEKVAVRDPIGFQEHIGPIILGGGLAVRGMSHILGSLTFGSLAVIIMIMSI